MKRVLALVLVVWMLLVPATAALAYNGPGACLTVKNLTGYSLTIRVEIPSIYDGGKWTFIPGEEGHLYYKGNPLVSTTEKNSNNGNFWINYDPGNSYVRLTWDYEADRNTSRGCIGTWTATFTPR